MPENQSFEELREAYKQAISELKAAQKRIGELEPIERDHTFRTAGFDPDSREGRLLAKLHGDEPITAESIAALAKEYDVVPPAAAASADTAGEPERVERSPETQARTEAAQRNHSLRDLAQPVGAQQVSWDDYKRIKTSNPREAFELMRDNRVDVPPEIAAVHQHNQLERSNQLVVTGGDL